MSTVTESNHSSPRSASPVESNTRVSFPTTPVNHHGADTRASQCRFFISDEDAALLIAWIESEEMTADVSFHFWTGAGFGLDEATPEDGDMAQGHLPPPPSPAEPARGAGWPEEAGQASSGSEDAGSLFDEEELARLCLEHTHDEREDGKDA